MFDLFDNVWGDSAEIVVDNCLDITLSVGQAWTLLYIFSDISFRSPFLSSVLQVVNILFNCCILMFPRDLGFGRRVTWTSDNNAPPGHQMTFKDALHVLSRDLILSIVTPKWASNLTERTRRVNLASDELKVPCANSDLLRPL